PLGDPGPLALGDFVRAHQPHLGIFVADIDVDVRRLDHPGRDQHAFDETMRILLEIVAVLEGAGLALVRVDREEPRRWLGADQGPLTAGRKARAAEAAYTEAADRLCRV